MALNPRQAKFCQLYADGASLGDAYLGAGYTATKVSAHANGHRLLKNAEVATEVDKLRSAIKERAVEENGLTLQHVIDELARVGFASVKQLLADDGTVIPLKDLPDDVAAAISSFSVSYSESPDGDGNFVRVRNVDVRFHSKLEALKQLAGHLTPPVPKEATTIIVLQQLVRQVREMSDDELVHYLESTPGTLTPAH